MLLRLVAVAIATLLVTSCGGDDLRPYLKEADATFGQSNTAAAFAAVSNSSFSGNDYFARLIPALKLARETVQAGAARWAGLEPPGNARSFHRDVSAYYGAAESLLVTMTAAAETGSYEKFFAATTGLADLLEQERDLNERWIALGKKARVDTSRIESLLRGQDAETMDVRRYILAVLPSFGLILDESQAIKDFGAGAEGGTFFSALEARFGRAAEKLEQARAAIAELRPPASATQTHESINLMIADFVALYGGIQRAGRERSFRAFGEAYQPLAGAVESTKLADCEWRRLAVKGQISTQTSVKCSSTDPQRLADAGYAVSALTLWGGIVDAVSAAGSGLSGTGSMSQSQAFAQVRSVSATLRNSATALLGEAHALKPSDMGGTFHASLESYLSELVAIAGEMNAAAAGMDSSRYNAAATRYNSLRQTGFVPLSNDLKTLWSDATAGIFR